MAAMDLISSETQKVMAVLPNFKYSKALAKEESIQEIQSQLKGLLQHSEEVKASIQAEMETAQKHLQEAETALEQVKDSERQGVAQLEAKVTTLVEAQMQLQDVEAEKKKVEAQHRDELREGDELREAKSKNITLNGSWTSKEDKHEKLAMLKEYLQDIGTEKTLVAAVDGLSTEPEVRGDFDKMAIDCITEEFSSKLQKVEEKLLERAPAERLMQAEILGLRALLDVSQEKATSAEDEHKQVEVVVKGSKTEMKTCKQQVTKYSKELQGLTTKMEAEETKVKTLEEASGAVELLVEAAKAAVAEAEKASAEAEAKAAAEKAEAEKAEAEQAAAAAAAAAAVEETKASPEETKIDDLEPPTKRLRTEDELKEAKLEAQVASPARVRVSIG